MLRPVRWFQLLRLVGRGSLVVERATVDGLYVAENSRHAVKDESRFVGIDQLGIVVCERLVVPYVVHRLEDADRTLDNPF